MIHKYVLAAERGEKQVELWGTGGPWREFLYADDAARALALAAERCRSSTLFNGGTGIEATIRGLAETISKLAADEGETVWNNRVRTASRSATPTFNGPATGPDSKRRFHWRKACDGRSTAFGPRA